LDFFERGDIFNLRENGKEMKRGDNDD